MSRKWISTSRRDGGRWARILSFGSAALLAVVLLAMVLLATGTTFAQAPGGTTMPPPSGSTTPPSGGATPPPPGGEAPPPPGSEEPPPPGDEPPPVDMGGPPLPGDGTEMPDDFSGSYGIPHCDGGWTKDDPYRITTYTSPTIKTVQELWNNTETFDNTVPFGVDLRIGESGVGSLYGDVTYVYEFIGADWVMINCWGMQHDIVDSNDEQIDMNVFPAEQYLFMQKHVDRNETLYVAEAANLTPGSVSPCVVGFGWVELNWGGEYMPHGVQVNGWEHLDCSDHDVTVGFEESYIPLFDGTTRVTRTDYWIVYDQQGAPQQGQATSVFIR